MIFQRNIPPHSKTFQKRTFLRKRMRSYTKKSMFCFCLKVFRVSFIRFTSGFFFALYIIITNFREQYFAQNKLVHEARALISLCRMPNFCNPVVHRILRQQTKYCRKCSPTVLFSGNAFKIYVSSAKVTRNCVVNSKNNFLNVHRTIWVTDNILLFRKLLDGTI